MKKINLSHLPKNLIDNELAIMTQSLKKEEKDKKKLALNSFEYCDCPHCRRKEKQIKKASGLKKKTMVININQK